MVERVRIEPCGIIEERIEKVAQYASMLVCYASMLVYYASMLVYKKENMRISIFHYARMNIWGYINIVPYLEVTRSTLVQYSRFLCFVIFFTLLEDAAPKP